MKAEADVMVANRMTKDLGLNEATSKKTYDITLARATKIDQIQGSAIDGKAKIKVDAGTQSGKVLRLKAKGLPDINSYSRGDILVNINVWTPQHLSKDEKVILEGLRDAENFKPNPTKKDRGFFERMKQYFE